MDLSKLNPKQKAVYAAWEAADPDTRFDLEVALAKYSTPAQRAKAPAKVPEKKATILRENRAVIMHLEKRGELVEVTCWQCKRKFAADYLYVRLCSDDCAAQYLFDTTGIKWDPEKDTDERWGFGVPPGIISPKTWAKMQEWAKRILEVKTLDEFRGHPIEDKVPALEQKQEVEHALFVAEPHESAMQKRIRETMEDISASSAREEYEKIAKLQKAYNETKRELEEIDLPRTLPRKNKFSHLL